MFYVYLLKGSDQRTYVGCTNDLKDRMSRHQAGYVLVTKGRRPLELLAYVAFREKSRAYRFEKYLKTGSGRAFLSRHFLYRPDLANTKALGVSGEELLK